MKTSSKAYLFAPLLLCLILTFCLSASAFPQKVLSIPMQGHTTTNSIKIWFMVEDVSQVEVSLKGRPGSEFALQTAGRPNWQGKIPLEGDFEGLEPGTEYEVLVKLDGVEWPEKTMVRTFSKEFEGEYSFMAGSCALYGTGAFRAIRPGTFTHIYETMLATPSDFFLWLGDNVYLLTNEWNSVSRTYEKYTKTRLEGRLSAFVHSRPQYAILDDHDFGPDNSGSAFENKGMTSACFADFWPNPYSGTTETQGNFCHFSHKDSDFFLLDDRFHRKAADKSQMYGAGQMTWLKEKLKASKAAFKFISTGSQSLSPVNQGEVWEDYAERQELFDFIKENKIEGVVFLSGDRHFTEMMKLQQAGMYPLYELTCSPLTSILRKKPLNEDDPEHINPLRLEGTLLVDHNFARLTVTGPLDDRTCVVEVFSAQGSVFWKREIKQRELRF